ncbi:MAG TPA: hypothetical protein VL593_00560 [Ramlibacter sp.]|jgi:hypothetical protein|nr:hypothetical protein [Ramlibacter sp.]
MNAASNSASSGIDPKPATKETDDRNKKTPSPEVQMEDAGTPASGNTGLGGRGSAAQGEIKQSGWKRDRGV